MNIRNKPCSRTDAERYLLNQMTGDEETLFQEHLGTCETCRSCLEQIRSLSQIFLKDDDRQHPFFKLRRSKKPSARYLGYRAAAAVILLAGGLAVFLSRRNAGQDGAHHLQIEYRHKATVEYADTTLEWLSPPYPLCTLNVRSAPLLFRWNRITAYRLRITSGDRTVIAVDSIGDCYTPDPAAVEACDSMLWTLETEELTRTGKIVIVNDQ